MVKQNPVLYDLQHEKYKDIKFKDDIWWEISLQIDSNCKCINTMTQKAMAIPYSLVQNRPWQTIITLFWKYSARSETTMEKFTEFLPRGQKKEKGKVRRWREKIEGTPLLKTDVLPGWLSRNESANYFKYNGKWEYLGHWDGAYVVRRRVFTH